MSFQKSVYSNIIRKNPLLTHKQEIELSRKAKQGDLKARQKLIESNFRLVISIAKKYYRSNCDFDDLIQESSTGLITAVDKFDPEKGYKFSTYACWWIKQAALSYVNEQTGSFKVPTHSRMLNSKIKTLVSKYERENDRKPTTKEISEILGENEKKIKYTIEANKPSVSMDKDKSPDDKSLSLKEKIEDKSYITNPEKNLEHLEMMSIIRQSLKCLTPKEEKIIRLRFGIGESESNVKEFPVTKDMEEYLNEK